jgi:cyclic pyranopterin phosphate synthase
MRQQKTPQLRIAVNSICGKACAYCRPGGEVSRPVTEEILSVDEIVQLTALLSRTGITDVKLTGGDPALYKEIVQLVHSLKKLSNIERVELVTRHPRAGRRADQLLDAGLDLLNFSLDSLDATTWSKITGVRGHETLVAAIENAANTGMPIKINMVVLKHINDHEVPEMIKFCRRIGASLKLLDLIADIGEFSDDLALYAERHYDDLARVITELERTGADQTIAVASGGLGHPMPTFHISGGPVVQVKTAGRGAWYSGICKGCQHFPCHDALMALRLTPDGQLQRCLLRSDNLVDLLTPLRAGADRVVEERITEVMSTYWSAQFYDSEAISLMRHDRSSHAQPTHVSV